MKKSYYLMLGMVLCLFITGFVFAQDDIEKHRSCGYCGMDREKFAHTRIYIEYDNGQTEGVCSLRCAALALATNMDKIPRTIWVGDYNTKNLIDAEKAFWVIGGSKKGVMTERGKWAFGKRDDAERFMKENGGNLTTFDEAIKAAYEDMYQDTKMIWKMRKMMMMENIH